MGVPKFFRYISERYPCLSELVRPSQVADFDNLYLDMNGIIHNCSHPNDNDIHFRISEEQIFRDIFFYLETLFNMIKPQKLFFMAVDGVAPRAKMNQQRGRRFRSAKDAEIQEEKARQKGEVLPTEARFDSNCITPGTPFMCRLNDALRRFIDDKIKNSKTWRDCKVILSGHETPGEGEHKIMEYIRFLKAQKGYDPNTRHCLYGLDADLIMLGLCTHERHFSLLREEVKFGKKNNKVASVSQQRFLLHLSLMREYLEQEFIALKGNMKLEFDIEKIIDDWVLMGFLVGNDFIPNIPNLHINTNALPILYSAYIKTMQNLDGYINEGGYLNLSRLQSYIENLAEHDRDHFTSQYDDLKFLEGKSDARNEDTFGGDADLMAMVKATEFEFDDGEDDDDDGGGDFEAEFHQHRRDYYVNKMKYEEMTPEVLAEQAECYIRALQWTLSYYYHGVQSWSWYYPHHYAPFISDITNFKHLKISFDMSAPFLPFQQLMSVLPAGSREHVPKCYQSLMTSPESEIIEFYPRDFETDLNGKKQEWEAVVLIPFIDEKRLLKTLQAHESELTPEERARNVHGPMYVFTSKDGEKKVFREEINVPKDRLVLGPSKGAMRNVYFVGFPTFKHLKYKSQLRKENVKVFDQPSRGENMIIVVDGENTDNNPRSLLNTTVYVGWPHLIEAKVMKVSDKDTTWFSDGTSDKTDANQFKGDKQAIRDHHGSRMGIDVGEIEWIVHVVQTTGEDYRLDSKAKILRLHKTYSINTVAYPLQCIVTNLKAYRKNFEPEIPLFEAFKNGTEVFMLTNPYYGAFGEVTDVNCAEKNGRVKVMLTVPQEPNFDSVWKLHEKTRGGFMNGYQAAGALGIGDNVFNRITGTVLVVSGNKRELSQESTSKINIGLQLKFPKNNEEVAGYTKKDRIWLYSEKVINLVQDYYCKFPSVFEVLGRRSGGSGNETYFEADFFSESGTLQELTKWLATLPSQKAERRQVGTEATEAEVVEAVRVKVEESAKEPVKKITMQVKPHLLYVPALSKNTVNAPDKAADFQLFDRVVMAKESEEHSIGDRGTVVGVSRVKDLNPVRRECVNKEDIYCDVLFDGKRDTSRIAIESLINISFGGSSQESRQKETKKPVQESKAAVKPSVSYSAILQKPQTRPNEPKVEADKNKKENFADMWNALKQGGASGNQGGAPVNQGGASGNQVKAPSKIMQGPPKPQHQPPKSTVAVSNEVPAITAPETLPLPPVEWLGNLKIQDQPVVPPPQVLPPAVLPPQVLPPAVLPPPMFFQNQPPVMLPLPPPPQFHPQHVNGNHFQPPMFFNGVNQPPPQRFFPNNNNNNNNFMNGQNRYNNNNRQQPHNYRPRPPPFSNHHQQHHQPPPQQASSAPAPSNPFIPLQASRKATKSKNDTQPQQQQLPTTPKEVKQEVETPVAAVVTPKSTGKSPAVDNRKSRLAISFN